LTPEPGNIISVHKGSPSVREVDRLAALSEQEVSLRKMGYANVAGVDEAGRGPLAGPLVASAVVFEPGVLICGVDDSKKLTSRKREELYDLILEHAVSVSSSIIDVAVLDILNVRGAANEAMRRAIRGLHGAADFVLIDGLKFEDVGLSHRFVTGGDRKCYAIAAASIVAKVTRDRIMGVLDRDYPVYGFSKNKGYPTKSHKVALKECGPTPVHRMSFPAVQRIVGENGRGRV
jgi:ribonuclease HII